MNLGHGYHSIPYSAFAFAKSFEKHHLVWAGTAPACPSCSVRTKHLNVAAHLGSLTCPLFPLPTPGQELAAFVGAAQCRCQVLSTPSFSGLEFHHDFWCPRNLPAVTTPRPFSWQAHMEAVHADWKEYLNLLICEESHLKYMEDYHQVPAGPGAALVGTLRAYLADFGPLCCPLREPRRAAFAGSHCPRWGSRVCLELARPGCLPCGPGLESVSSPGQCEAQK